MQGELVQQQEGQQVQVRVQVRVQVLKPLQRVFVPRQLRKRQRKDWQRVQPPMRSCSP
jgi:hypothetical protein